MDINFKYIDDKFEKYNYQFLASSWDKKYTYCYDREYVGVDIIYSKMILALFEEEVVGVGVINPESNLKYAYLTSIVKPNYRRMGIADKLLKEMLYYCKDVLDLEKVKVNIVINNKASISQIEKNEFDFVSFNDNIISFEKKLINE